MGIRVFPAKLLKFFQWYKAHLVSFTLQNSSSPTSETPFSILHLPTELHQIASLLFLNIGNIIRTSLVAQWLRIHLPMQGTRVRALVREDPTGCGATKPVRHNYWACALEPVSHNYWSPCATTTEPVHPRARAPQQKKQPQWEAHTPQLEKARTQQQRPKNKQNFKNNNNIILCESTAFECPSLKYP